MAVLCVNVSARAFQEWSSKLSAISNGGREVKPVRVCPVNNCFSKGFPLSCWDVRRIPVGAGMLLGGSCCYKDKNENLNRTHMI